MGWGPGGGWTTRVGMKMILFQDALNKHHVESDFE